MLSIRLTRTGKAHTPHYRIIVQEKRSKLGGKAVDYIGHYHPADKDKLLVIDKDKARKWLAAGAQPSDTVTNLLVKQGVLDKSRTVHHFYTPTKKEAAPAAEAAPAVEETPAEEPAVEVDATPEEEVAETAEETTEEAPVAEEVAPEEAPAEEPKAEEAA